MRKSTNEEFIAKAQEVHGKYSYCKTNYVNKRVKVTITCPVHGDFEQSPNSHLSGCGCPRCGSRFTTEKFIIKATDVHGSRYDYSKTNYIHSRTKVIITCPIHGDFSQEASSHLVGHGCSSCAIQGFDKTKPAILYYLKINGGQAYKIGITNRTVDERFSNSELQLIEIVKTWYYTDGAECYDAEQKILKDYSAYKYNGHDILKSGNTELFTINVLDL